MNVLLINAEGVVENCICADSVERAAEFYPGHTCLERAGDLAAAGPGWITVDGVLTAPPPPPHVPPVLTPVEFLQRIPRAKRVAIREGGKTNPIVADIMYLLENSSEINTSSDETAQALAYLLDNGYLTIDDVNAIVA
jgi:hypothetical protein